MESPTLQRLLARLKQLRTQLGLTQEEFADKFGLSYKYYQALEAGRKKDPRLSTLDRLAAVHGLEAWQLLLPIQIKHQVKTARVRKKLKIKKARK
jgi:transcriptional regulator with XRE-family HTH domain